ncbi:alpha-galactosidase [Actinomyces lilanjuaniae]|uniref:Alpha-galactosidase n=1 Tax=Actinomyces lilanjuaniae TaxID=2321394 RepID=A0ABM6Z5P5_9ACTO|nr:glycoside hydrolase family 36 protein [Actinomyces lilanjuaniae]AYD90668.1 alpha-galactosidase [Actinomyces lilanjuaniae]
MIHQIDLGGRSIALATDGDVTRRDGKAYVRAAHLSLLHDMRGGEVYRTGQTSWSPSGWQRLADPPLRVANPVRRRTADDDLWDDPTRHHSSWVAVVEDAGPVGEKPAGEVVPDRPSAVLVGCLEGETPRVRVDEAALEAFTETGRPGRWVILVGSATQVMTAYARQLGAYQGRREIRPQSVWCSWYSYYEGVSEEAVAAEIPEVARCGFSTLQIDDGWQAGVGDWHAGPRFPSGMKAVADAVWEADMTPGLWVAPFIALPGSRAVREHPEAFVRAADGSLAVAGSNWGSHYHALDMTHPRAQDLVYEVIDRVVHEWGFSYLKLDFLNAAAVPGVRAQDTDREQAYREGLRLVRQAAGEDVFLLGSGALLMPSVGVLDAVRVGPDVAPMWDNYATDDPSDATARNALRASASRLWLGEVIGVDPDVAFFRHRRNLLDDTQMLWLRELAAACRFRCVSDRTAWLEEAEKKALRTWVTREEEVELLGRYRFRVGGREVDLTEAVEGSASPYPL